MDTGRIKRNISRLMDAGLSDADIEEYLRTEGTTSDDFVRAVKSGQQPAFREQSLSAATDAPGSISFGKFIPPTEGQAVSPNVAAYLEGGKSFFDSPKEDGPSVAEMILDLASWASPQTIIAKYMAKGTPTGYTASDFSKVTQKQEMDNPYVNQAKEMGTELLLQKGMQVAAENIKPIGQKAKEFLVGKGDLEARTVPFLEELDKLANETLMKTGKADPTKARLDLDELDPKLRQLVGKHFPELKKIPFNLSDFMKLGPDKGMKAPETWHDFFGNEFVRKQTTFQFTRGADLGKIDPQGSMTRIANLTASWPELLENGEKLTKVVAKTPTIGLADLLVRRSKEVVKRSGVAGKELAGLVDSWENAVAQKAGHSQSIIINTLQKLNSDEYKTLSTVLEGAKPISPAQESAAKTIRGLLNSINKDAEKFIKVEGKNYVGREDYFPHYHDLGKIGSGKGLQDTAEKMVADGTALTIEDAKNTIKEYVSRRVGNKMGALERHRSEFEIPGYNTDPMEVLLKYTEDAHKRLEWVKRFGQDDMKATQLFDAINKESGDDFSNFSRTYLKGVEEGRIHSMFDVAQPLFSFMKGYNTATKMEWASINNVFQKVNLTLRTSIRDSVRAAFEYRSPEAMDFAVKSGAILESVAKDAMEKMGADSGLVAKGLKITGFTKSEQMNRVFAATAGKIYMLRMTNKLVSNPADKEALLAMKEVGLDAKVVLDRGHMTMEELYQAANKIAAQTQFKAGINDLPIWWSTPEGKLLTQFKNFSYNQTIYFYDQLQRAHTIGGVPKVASTVLKWAVLFGASGEIVADIRSMIAGKKRESNLVKRWLNNLMYAGGIGLLTDELSAALYGGDSLRKQLLGPTVSDVTDFASNAAKAGTGNMKPLTLQMLKAIPVAGDLIYSKLRKK